MNSSIKMITAAVVIVVLGAALYYVSQHNSSSSITQMSQADKHASSEQKPETQTPAATITYTDDGFTPANTIVKSGDTVKIVNNSSEELQMDSDPHPAHTDDTELNVGIVSPGASKTFVLTTKGNWGFHNHLNPSNTAKVDVQ